MKVMVRFGVLFYMTILLFLGSFMLLFVFGWIRSQDIAVVMYIIENDMSRRIVLGVSTGIILLMNYLFVRAISGSQQRGKTIAFDNPSGRVSVSLSAMEDLTRRLISKVPEVKEVKSSILAGKKGLEVEARLVLNTDVNIPEMTSKLQDLVKRKIQDTIGIEENVVVRVHVIKIIPGANKVRQNKDNNDLDNDEKVCEPTVPFQGYRA